MLTGQEGKLFSPLAWTKSLAMNSAAAIAITLVPVLMVWFLRGRFVSEEKNPVSRVGIAMYTPLLKWALRASLDHARVERGGVGGGGAVGDEHCGADGGFACGVSALRWDLWGDERPEVVIEPIGSEVLVTPNEGDLLYMPTTLPGVSISSARASYK